jgi:hypothetical protein
MNNDFTKVAEQLQEQTLSAVKQAQDMNMAAFEQTQKFFEAPSPVKFVELSFDYASKFLELRKQYALQVAEMFNAAGKNVAKNVSEN